MSNQKQRPSRSEGSDVFEFSVNDKGKAQSDVHTKLKFKSKTNTASKGPGSNTPRGSHKVP
jgi:hypothetical protein